MDPLRWQRICELFAAARELDAEKRVQFLAEPCRDDPSLRQEVLQLLEQESKKGPLDSTPTVSNLPVPTIVAGRFRIVRYIAEGGMGTVYEAEDLQLHERVALKTIRADVASDARAIERFKREIQLGKSITHPNVCRIHDLVVDRSETGTEVFFLSMQFLDGGTLASRIKQGPIPQSEAWPLIEDMADGLSAAHRAGVVHRDFKSGNVMLVEQHGRMQAVITDFGLARDIRGEASRTLTQFAGTLDYMAPEQITGEEVSPATDIYAFGVVMYEMVTGQRPFTGESIARKHLRDEPRPPRLRNQNISVGLDAIILKCLEKDPKVRFQSANDLIGDLKEPGKGSAPHRLTAARKKTAAKTRCLMIACVSVILLAVGLGYGVKVLRAKDKQTPPVSRQIVVLPFRLSGAQPQEAALFEGLTDTLTTRLTSLTVSQPVGIIPFSDVVANHVSDMQQARRELGANLALDGHVERDGNQWHINLALSDIAAHRLLRADTVSGTSDHFKDLEERAVEVAARMLQLELHKSASPDEARNTTSGDAYEAFIRGKGYLSRNLSREDSTSAIAEFTHALELDPGYAIAYAFLGRAYWANYQLTKDPQVIPKIQDACAHALKMAPSSAAANTCEGVLEEGTGHYEDAAASFQLALDADPTNDFVYQRLGQAYEHLGRFPQAEQTYKNAIKIHPENANDYTWLGGLYNRETRYGEAAMQFQHAVNLAQENAGLWSRLGGTYFFAGDYSKAEYALNRSISLQPTYGCYSNLGETYFLERKFEDAIQAFERSAALGEHQTMAYGNLARAYYWYPPMHNRAKPLLKKAIEFAEADLQVNGNDPDAHTLVAEYYAMLGDKKDALRHIQTSLRLSPEDAETEYFAAKVYNLLGNREEALNWLEKSVKAGYSPAEIRNTIELDSLRSDPRFEASSHRLHA